jgi:hypothetical protein
MSGRVANCRSCDKGLGAFNRSGFCRACLGREAVRRRAANARAEAAAKIEQIHDALRAAAVVGAPCPTNTDLARRFGGRASHISTVVHDLARAGRFEIQQWGRTREIIFADGYSTAARAEWVAVRDAVARAFGLEPYHIVGVRRRRHIARARFGAAWVLMHRFPVLSYHGIGKLLGGRDHSTVINEIERADDLRERDGEFRAITDALLHGEPVARVEPVPIARVPKPRAKDLPPPPLSTMWCGQCESRVTAESAARCRSPWCSVRQDEAA